MADFRSLPLHALSSPSHRPDLLARGRNGIMKSLGALRFAFATALIAATAILLQARGRNEITPQRLPLSSFPAQLGHWDSTEITLDPKTLEVLGRGDFMERIYRDLEAKRPY